MTTYTKNNDGTGGFFDESAGGSADFTPPEDKLAGKPIKKFLYAMQVKGAKICDALQITNSGEVYLKDGTGMSSLVKDVEFFSRDVVIGHQAQYEEGQEVDGEDVGGQLYEGAENGAGLEGNETDGWTFDGAAIPAGVEVVAIEEKQHFLKITRPNGQIEEKPAQGMDQMLNGMDSDGLVESIPELVQKIGELRSAVMTAASEQAIARGKDVDVLESAFDKFIVDAKTSLGRIEDAVLAQANARDVQILDDGKDRLAQIQLAMNSTMDRDYGHCEIDFSDLSAASLVRVVMALDSVDAPRIDISNYAVKTAIQGGTGANAKMSNHSIWHQAFIADGDDGKELHVDVRGLDCDEVHASDKVQVTVAYCGPLTSVDDPAPTTPRTARLYNLGGSDLAFTAEGDLPDSDSNGESGEVQKISLTEIVEPSDDEDEGTTP